MRGRRSIRLKDYDYTQPGYYFITIVSHDRACSFGKIATASIVLSAIGKVISACWQEIPAHFPDVTLDVFVIMPNHLHGIVVINDIGRGTTCRAPTNEQFGKPVKGSIPTIIRSFKAASSRQLAKQCLLPPGSVWQKNYYEHVILNESELNLIREYILANPVRWDEDEENPDRRGTSCPDVIKSNQ
jgi:putative transposase